MAAYKGYISLMNLTINPDCHLLFVINLADWGSLWNGIRYIVFNVYVYIYIYIYDYDDDDDDDDDIWLRNLGDHLII